MGILHIAALVAAALDESAPTSVCNSEHSPVSLAACVALEPDEAGSDG